MFRSSWIADYNDAQAFLAILHSNSGINLTHYRSAQFDDLLDRATMETDADKRRALLNDGERTMLGDVPLIPLYFYVSKHLVKPQIGGWYSNIMNVVYSKDPWLNSSD
jgi:ABC-type oligopeptide transport system substrate-binding subunit